ncbi:methyltransferase-like protein 23 isoform X1 [Asparagus officinalis]|uniref:methyltransferase-like protein 23 isoform X1 n=1 Tax=Asparagus officinalis TaxID=4686 RepID=UPI00098E101D|nr:methyltransferase-like protein 23 isoform X1 [Asparagus officinalis]
MGGGGAAQESSQSSSPRSSPHPSSPTTATSSKSMTTISRHYFGRDSSDGSHDFFVDIIESMEEEYGMFVWPCSIILAEYVWQQRFRFSGATVAEFSKGIFSCTILVRILQPCIEKCGAQLGAGTSLPGLVAAKLGADVTLTDNSNRPEVLDNMKRICELNNLNCEILGITWGEWDSPMFDLHPQILLGADVFYDTIDFEDLFATVTFLLQRSPGSVFITAYHNRSGHHLIEFLMVKWRLKCVKLLDGFSIMPSIKASSLQGNIQLVEIILDGQ